MARFLADAIRAREDFELLADPGLSIVNFRYHPAGIGDEAPLDRLNRQIVNRLVASGACIGSVVEGNLLDGNTRGPLNVRRARGLTVVREADAP